MAWETVGGRHGCRRVLTNGHNCRFCRWINGRSSPLEVDRPLPGSEDAVRGEWDGRGDLRLINCVQRNHRLIA